MDKYLIEENSIYALIPARGGSKGVPGKNIRLIKDYPLIAYSIAICQMSSRINRTIVTTDSKEIAMIAEKFGAEVPFLRPSEFAGDKSGDIEFVMHALGWFEENEGRLPAYIVHIRPTTPLREREVVDMAIEKMICSGNATSLRSAHKAPESPFKWFVKNDSEYFHSIVENISNEEANSGRQNFQDVYIPDGYVDVIKTEFVIDNGILHGDKMLAFESPMCMEIDTEEELEMIEYQLQSNQNEVYRYLLQNYAHLQMK